MAKQKKMSQEEVWNKISKPWKEFRAIPEKNVIEFLKGKKGNLLDLACGSGRNFVKFNGKIYGTDFSVSQVNFAKKYAKENKINAIVNKTEADKISFEDNFFDCAIYIKSLHCIESAKSREKSLKEIFRVLKSKARVLIAVWSRNQERIKNKPKEAQVPWTVGNKKYMRYYYIYEKEELEQLLKNIGFKIIKSWEDENIWIETEKP